MTNASDGKRDFFVSFNQADRAWATWIAWVLEEAGYSVFFQDWDFKGNFVLEMDRAYKSSNRTIALFSPDYLGSRFMAPEWAARFTEDATGERDLLIPVRVRPCEPKGLLAQIVCIDLFDLDEKTATKRLLNRIRNIRLKPSDAPTFPSTPDFPAAFNVRKDEEFSNKDIGFGDHDHKYKYNDEVIVFLSYTRLDDEFFRGYISSLRDILEKAVRVVTGNRKFTIFQDVDNIKIGENWQERLRTTLGRARCLIPIITPSFITSDMCRDELSSFMSREHDANSRDLILPIYLVTSDVIENENKTNKDDLIKKLSERQWFDWRPYIDMPLDDPRARQAIMHFANGIQGVLDRSF
jgi:hypothetical protein